MTKIPKPINSARPRTEQPRPSQNPPGPSTSTAPSHPPSNLVQGHPGASAFDLPSSRASRVAVHPEPTRLHAQGNVPALAPSTRPVPPLNMDKVSCLTHGIHPDFVLSTLQSGQLSSAYQREGPAGRYSRDADKNGGGGLAVYTRAVGTEQTQWRAQGYGVGSNADKVQMILKPSLLESPGHAWRASSMDNMGLVPGAPRTEQAKIPKGGSPLNARPLWGFQTESGRNSAFNSSVTGSTLQVNNEQLHWEKIPLEGNLKGMVCTSQASFDKMMNLPGAYRSRLPMPQGLLGLGSVVVGDQRVPIAFTQGNLSLASTLQLSGIANSSNQVR